MSLLLSSEKLLLRRRAARGALGDLASGLHRELEPLRASLPDVPREKALLSRAGGRCDRDGSLLTYDPFDPGHRCAVCGQERTGEVHDRFRLYWHQLWLAERAVHAAAVGVLLDEPTDIALAIHLLDRYADQYLLYPNRDNALGPSRPFFSTYLESIWLLQLTIALDLLETAAPRSDVQAVGARVRDRIVEPSVELIASYDEGASNRQVWNDAALAAAGVLLRRPALLDRAVHGPSGIERHLMTGLLADGSWYEGENYHLFAHRGLWYGVAIAEAQGHRFASESAVRFREGFAAPFRTLLPDLTYPSRRDSQYAVSVRQPRFAESCELGLARGDDDRLTGMLARLYDPAFPRGETGRRSSSADVERNVPATGLTRADLSWRALLFAREELPPLRPTPFESELLPAQGFGVLRRDGGTLYAALDYGRSGGGHGHPDRLNVIFCDGANRWFDDPGTGSYVDPSLRWYRSTLAHTAPLVDARSQPPADGRLLDYDVADDARSVAAEVRLAPDLVVRRAISLVGDTLVDVLEWETEGAAVHEMALPLHGVELTDRDGNPLAARAERIAGRAGREDGFSFLERGGRVEVGTDVVHARPTASSAATRDGRAASLRGWLRADGDASWWSALAPDVPTRPGLVPMVLARVRGGRGRLVGVWSSRDTIADVAFSPDAIEIAWRHGPPTRHELAMPTSPPLPRSDTPASSMPAATRRMTLPALFALGEPHYRRSEQTWREAGSPSADVRVAAHRDGRRELSVGVEVRGSTRRFVPIGAENRLDNEPAAINGDGVQLYVAVGERRAGWLLIPDPASNDVAVHPIDGWRDLLPLTATWDATDDGYALSARIELPADTREVALDVLVNETAAGRERRRGQLVMSGAAGEFVYLRGDRHEPERLVHFVLPDA